MYFLGFVVLFVIAPACIQGLPQFLARNAEPSPDYHIPIPILSQHQSQYAQGTYRYGFDSADSEREESRSDDGSVIGSYSYIDQNGVKQIVHYRADAEHGFQVQATPFTQTQAVARNLPVDTPEVAKARAEHLKHFQGIENDLHNINAAAVLRHNVVPVAPKNVIDGPIDSVTETPEVAAARAAHLNALRTAALRDQTDEGIHSVVTPVAVTGLDALDAYALSIEY